MKRLLFTLLLLVFALFMTAVIGWQKGQTCPPFVGYACYELSHGEQRGQLLQFIEKATQSAGDTHFVQHRWPGAQDAAQAVSAYRASLRYSVTRSQGHPRLNVWCLASTGETAADGPTFPGQRPYAAEFGAPSFQKGMLVSQTTRPTALEKMLYGLGLFPPGEPLP
ncbi:hypothetical protein [Prosthecobacter sp.]|uniref:hypothetical protein n=1 Tax=Prosthecobacter sp. TaxID=1965333 RepID=UPI0037833CA2